MLGMFRYGMGMIFDKMGKNDLALIHYKEAQKLNPSSGVLLYRVGTVRKIVFARLPRWKLEIVFDKERMTFRT